MKRMILMFAMAVALVSAVAQRQQKTIIDPDEYNSFMTALYSGRSSAIERFLQRFPNTVVKEEALDRLMAVHQQLDDDVKMADAANRLLEVNPNNIRALALLAYLKNTEAKTTPDGERAAQLRHDAAEIAKRGLTALPLMRQLTIVSDEDYEKLIKNVQRIFNALVSADSSSPDLPPVFIPQIPPPAMSGPTRPATSRP